LSTLLLLSPSALPLSSFSLLTLLIIIQIQITKLKIRIRIRIRKKREERKEYEINVSLSLYRDIDRVVTCLRYIAQLFDQLLILTNEKLDFASLVAQLLAPLRPALGAHSAPRCDSSFTTQTSKTEQVRLQKALPLLAALQISVNGEYTL
jgi:hypothetical protein